MNQQHTVNKMSLSRSTHETSVCIWSADENVARGSQDPNPVFLRSDSSVLTHSVLWWLDRTQLPGIMRIPCIVLFLLTVGSVLSAPQILYTDPQQTFSIPWPIPHHQQTQRKEQSRMKTSCSKRGGPIVHSSNKERRACKLHAENSEPSYFQNYWKLW